jgi:hypothetical protein
LAWYLAAVRLPSDPFMTARPSVVDRHHLQARPRFLSRISKSGSCSGIVSSVSAFAAQVQVFMKKVLKPQTIANIFPLSELGFFDE